MTKKLVALFIALCLALGCASAFAEKLTVMAWDDNFNGNALRAAAEDYKANVDPEFELEIIIVSGSSDVEQAINRLLLPICTLVLTDACFKSHGDINLYASAVAYYLNEGDNANDARHKARQFLNVQTAHAERLRSRGFELFDEFRQMVETHFSESSEGLRVGDGSSGIVRSYAERLNVSTSYLAQVTKRISGQAPKAIIDEKIISEARRLLTSTSLTVQEISYQLGFTNQAHFTKYFKKLTGLTPSDFRIKH